MITIDEFKRAFSQQDVIELLSADNLSESEQLVLFEELKERALAKIKPFNLEPNEAKFILSEFIMIELKKRHASIAEHQALVDTEQMLLSRLERAKKLSSDLLQEKQKSYAACYTPMNTKISSYL